MVGKAESNEQIDDDILQCREDVLRSRDVATSKAGGKVTAFVASKDKEQKTDKNTNPIPIETATPKKPSALMAAVVEGNKKLAAKTPDLGQAKTKPDKILKFDLAEEIMSEQRKITSIKRKSPGRKTQIEPVKSRPATSGVKGSKSKLPARNQIIVEIVARDIKRFCQERQ